MRNLLSWCGLSSPLGGPAKKGHLFGFLLAWQDLLWALCLISIDEKRTVTLGVAFTVGEFIIQWPMLTAASLIASLPTIILYLFLQRFYVEGLARGAVKG